jgi:2-desacetyl-2-hydroxyethyl bacteriochlorophyllide A dehydrogenase
LTKMLNEYQQSALYLQAERSPFPGIANPQPHQLYRNPQLDIRSRQLGPIFPGHIRVQMIYAGICGTDIHLVNPDLLTGYVQSSAPAYLPDEGRLIGHEGVGKILEVASDVTGLTVCQFVAFESIQSCHACEACRQGQFNQCLNSKLIGMEVNGIFGTVVDIPAILAFDVSRFGNSDRSLQAAACLEPAGVAFLACANAAVSASDRVAILGAGPIGLLTVMLCRLAFGASFVSVVEPSEYRKNLARKWADESLTPDQFKSDHGVFDVLIDTSGDLDLVSASITRLRHNGRVCLLARSGRALVVDSVDHIISSNISIMGSRGHLGGIYERLAALYENGRLPIDEIVTKVISGLSELAEHLKNPRSGYPRQLQSALPL